MLIVLDIDETLIHSSERKIPQYESFRTLDYYWTHKRPHLDKFLTTLLKDNFYEVGIWTAGATDYGKFIVDKIIPPKLNHRLKFVMTRPDCEGEDNNKPLQKAINTYNKQNPKSKGKYTISDVLLIDDRKGVTQYNNLNHLQIAPFEAETYSDKEEMDQELDLVLDYLMTHKRMRAQWLATNWRT